MRTKTILLLILLFLLSGCMFSTNISTTETDIYMSEFNGVLAVGTSDTQVTGLTELNVSTSIFSTTNGAVTINDTGIYSISAYGLFTGTANNRVECVVRIQKSNIGGTSIIAEDKQYCVRNTAQDQGSAQVNNNLVELEQGDSLLLLVRRNGDTANLVNARLSIIRVG